MILSFSHLKKYIVNTVKSLHLQLHLLVEFTKPKNRYFPIELEYRIESNSEELDVTMKNINIQPFGKPKEKLEQTIRRMMRTGVLE